MKLTTKIAIFGFTLILFILWLSFFYLNTPNQPPPYEPLIPPHLRHLFPEKGIDLVLTWTPPNSLTYQQSREEWIQKTPEIIDDKSIAHETRRYHYRGIDYLRFNLRGIDVLTWVRFLVVVYPDGTTLSPSLNVSSPRVKIVTHSNFIPHQFLPTFNPEVVKMYLHKIPELSEEFVYFNENTFILGNLELSFFRKSDTEKYIVRTVGEGVLPFQGHMTQQAQKNTYKLFPPDPPGSSTPIIESLGPVLINKKLMEETHSQFPESIQNTSQHRFLLHTDICPLDVYFLSLLKKGSGVREKSTVRFVTGGNTENVVLQIQSLQVDPNSDGGGSVSLVYVAEDVLKGRFKLGRTELDSLFYEVYPKVSRLEVNVEDYTLVSLVIALVILFGGVGGCFFVTRALGGHIKRDKWNS